MLARKSCFRGRQACHSGQSWAIHLVREVSSYCPSDDKLCILFMRPCIPSKCAYMCIFCYNITASILNIHVNVCILILLILLPSVISWSNELYRSVMYCIKYYLLPSILRFAFQCGFLFPHVGMSVGTPDTFLLYHSLFGIFLPHFIWFGLLLSKIAQVFSVSLLL